METKWIVPAINIKQGGGIAKAGKPVPVEAERAGQLIQDKKATAYEQPEASEGQNPTTGTLQGVLNSQGNLVDLEQMDLTELEALAIDLDIEGYESMTPEELAEAIRAEPAEVPELEELEPEHLKALAKDLSIPGFGNMKRETLIEKIREAEAKGGDGE